MNAATTLAEMPLTDDPKSEDGTVVLAFVTSTFAKLARDERRADAC